MCILVNITENFSLSQILFSRSITIYSFWLYNAIKTWVNICVLFSIMFSVILLACGKHFYVHIISIWGEVWVKKNQHFNTATFYWSDCTKPGNWPVVYLCVRNNDFPVSTILIFDFGNVVFLWVVFFHCMSINNKQRNRTTSEHF